MRFIADLFQKEDGVLYSREQLKSVYKVSMTFLCYRSLVKSIPTNIQNSDIKKMKAPILPYKLTLLSKKVRTSQVVYNSLIEVLTVYPKLKASKLEWKWKRDVGQMHFDTVKDIRYSTTNSYLQSFHYRIVNRIVATNTFLYRIGKSDSPLCFLCRRSNETLLRALWSCNSVQNFIGEIKLFMRSKCNATLNINLQNWFFPRCENESRLNILIITVAKHAIMRSRQKKCHPHLQLFLALLKDEAIKEKGAAIRHQTLHVFEKKWGSVANILQS